MADLAAAADADVMDLTAHGFSGFADIVGRMSDMALGAVLQLGVVIVD